MAASAPLLTNGSKENGPPSLSYCPSPFFDQFCVAHGVPVLNDIAAGTAGLRVGGPGTDTDRDRPRPGQGDSIVFLPRCSPSVVASSWTAGGQPVFQQQLGTWLRGAVADWWTGSIEVLRRPLCHQSSDGIKVYVIHL